jgi:hypothetical protein
VYTNYLVDQGRNKLRRCGGCWQSIEADENAAIRISEYRKKEISHHLTTYVAPRRSQLKVIFIFFFPQ